ncbi:hypothetical protein ACIBQ6_36590 [Nonomuraea sp. NPDC049655]|uniref:hypothetical protein n=1 Tax=Nonomuraea sp. NPDC049655 TaxID=3364355 RepID=UPI0037A8F546
MFAGPSAARSRPSLRSRARRLPWAARRLWPQLLLTVLALAVTVSGPVALTLYDVATQGTPGDCVLPWWPAWLPT